MDLTYIYKIRYYVNQKHRFHPKIVGFFPATLMVFLKSPFAVEIVGSNTGENLISYFKITFWLSPMR
jgi:hypothetical protein